jgi:hypothetical protein
LAKLILNGATSGSITLESPSVSGSNTLTLPANTGTVITTGSTDTVNSLNAGIGVNQTWTDVTASRAIGTTYTNSTGKPIMVAISYTNSAGATVQGLVIGGVTVYAAGSEVGNGSGFSLLVPNGLTYVTTTNGGTMTKVTWYELR